MDIIRKNISSITQVQRDESAERTRANRISDWITQFSGSIVFVALHAVWFGIWILLMHMLDIYWNIIPERGPSLGKGVWIAGAWIGDVVAIVTICSLMGYVFLRTLGKYSLYQWRNPRLLESANVVN